MALTARKSLQNIKYAYDIHGLDGCMREIERILEWYPDGSERANEAALWLFNAMNKIDTCKSDCFENLDSKISCVCLCNDMSMIISLDSHLEVGKA